MVFTRGSYVALELVEKVYSALDQVGLPTFDGLTNVKRWQLVFLRHGLNKLNILVVSGSCCGPCERAEWAGYITTYV